MRKRSVNMTCSLVIVATASVATWVSVPGRPGFADEESTVEAAPAFGPVDDMHHFMEYINEPIYQSLETALKKPPRDRDAWSKVKSGAMILAETSGLVAERGDNASEQSWKLSSEIVYKEGKVLYEAARKKDYELAKKSFKAMTVGCQKCHEEYR